MKSKYKIARVLEIFAIVELFVFSLAANTESVQVALGEQGINITRWICIGAAIVLVIVALKFSVCPHCGRYTNVLRSECRHCHKKFRQE